MSFLAEMDGGILSHRVKKIKPDSGIYLLLLEQYGLKAEESVSWTTPRPMWRLPETGYAGIAVRDQAQAEEELKRLLEEQTE